MKVQTNCGKDVGRKERGNIDQAHTAEPEFPKQGHGGLQVKLKPAPWAYLSIT